MALSTANWLFIGNFGEMDTDESDFDNENGNLVLGTYTPANMQIVTVTGNDADNDGAVRPDDAGWTAEDLSYDTGSGSTTSALDSEAIYNATLVTDGGTVSTTVVVIQTQNGDAFILSHSLNNTTIHSVELTSVNADNFGGISAPVALNGDISNSSLICFCGGTLIETPFGPIPIEQLCVGDLVRTLV